MTVRALVLTGYGLNCDRETAYALRIAGAKADRVHINGLIDGEVLLGDYQMLVFGGGFSWGDDHGAGVVQAVRMRTKLGDQILEFVASGNLILGICNGFQTLVNMGLLPGLNGDYTARKVALTHNDCGNFRDQWVDLKVNSESPCVFTKGMDSLTLPVRHGEGKFVADSGVVDQLKANHQIVLQYANADGTLASGKFPLNPNGSLLDIAGICDPTGRIFGLMPHPEAYIHPTNHPDWFRMKVKKKRDGTTMQSTLPPGIIFMENGVKFLTLL